MDLATETPSSQGNAKMRPGGADAVLECDFCGRPVRRETAPQRIHRGRDGVELVLVCPECELGTD